MMIKRKDYEQEFDFIKSCGIEDHVIKSSAGQNGHSDVCFVELPGVEFRAGERRHCMALLAGWKKDAMGSPAATPLQP